METFTALADPTRHQIIEMLSAGELSAGEISRCFEMSAPAVSQHLKALKAAHLVRVRVDAQRRIYTMIRMGSRRSTPGFSACAAFDPPERFKKYDGILSASTLSLATTAGLHRFFVVRHIDERFPSRIWR